MVSIHPMLLFNYSKKKYKQNRAGKFQYIPCYCSTNLCLRFQVTLRWFQYIPCYCSTNVVMHSLNVCFCFNTSHVTVQRFTLFFFHCFTNRFQYIPCYCSTIQSVQLPLLTIPFQYIPCYCSTYINYSKKQ